VELMEHIMKFGFGKADASDILAAHSDDVIRTAISLVEIRASMKNMSPLGAPAGYFRWQLQDLIKNPQPPQMPSPKTPALKKPGGPSVMESFLSARAQEALAVHKELDDKERKTVFDSFKDQTANKSLKLDRGLDSAMVRSLFSHWYAKELWGEPSADALARFIEQRAAAAA